MATIGGKIRAARKEAGYTNAEGLAVALGVGVRTIQRWEADDSEPSISRLIEIGKITNQPLSYFMPEETGAVA